jgi:hypothetical protein
MSKSILVWGAPSQVSPDLDYQSAFIGSGNNFGNILIGNAVTSFLKKNDVVLREELNSPEEANERCFHVVIPAANFLWRDFDFGYMANFIEKTNLPVTIIGVGAQTNDRTTSSEIHPNTLRLMRIISDRSASLGVRGFYTAEVLAAHGIHNSTVIGCPSLYTNRCPSLVIDGSKLKSIDSLSVNFSRRVKGHAFNPATLQKIENSLLGLALSRNSTFVAQDEIQEIALAHGEPVDTKEICNYFNETEEGSVIKFFKENTKYFTEVDSWSRYIRTQAASIGTRFHGNLIALINGIPALTIVHDSRTMEMCTLMNAPKIHISQINDVCISKKFLLEALETSDYSAFESTYKILYSRFVSFLDDNGLMHNLIRKP